MYKMRIRYYNTLYKKESTMNVFGNIEFKNGSAHFASMGRRYAIEAEYIISIEPLED